MMTITSNIDEVDAFVNIWTRIIISSSSVPEFCCALYILNDLCTRDIELRIWIRVSMFYLYKGIPISDPSGFHYYKHEG